MAYTHYTGSWTSTGVPTASDMNTYVRDNLKALYQTGAIQTADVDFSASTTLTDLPGLYIDVKAGEEWVMIGSLFASSTAAADLMLAITAPDGSVGRYGALQEGGTVGGSATTSSFGTGVMTAWSATIASAVRFACWVQVGKPGKLQVQAAQYAASGSSTVYEGSFMTAWRVGG